MFSKFSNFTNLFYSTTGGFISDGNRTCLFPQSVALICLWLEFLVVGPFSMEVT